MRAPLVAGIVAAVCAAVSAPAVTAAAATPTPSGPASSAQLSARDRAFLTEADRNAQFGVAAGRVAVARVRAFGTMMVTGHGAQHQQLQALDRSLGLTPPSAPGPEQQKVLAIWSSLRGGPFDCAYAPTIYADHELDMYVFTVMAQQADNAQVRAFAKAMAPTLAPAIERRLAKLARCPGVMP